MQFQVTGLKAGTSYVFAVRAQNIAGVGKSSAVLGPILAQTRPGECDYLVTHSVPTSLEKQGNELLFITHT